jgi:hypothetical protein
VCIICVEFDKGRITAKEARRTLGEMVPKVGASEEVSISLVEVWRKRRAAPSLLTQPKEQWPNGRSSATRGFAGYKPGTIPFQVDAMVSDETFGRRLKTAAVNDDARKKWDKFD